jgi:A/G-specific adenine glycosylase
MDFFSKRLIKWYKINKRDLPWRGVKDPYKIWLSEIILQQTQVVQGLSYYLKFIEHYPNVKILAKATSDQVMKDWQGLGYYSRARNLHEAAKYVVNKHKGVFPKTYEAIRELKGVGDYTAAAIASLAYDLPHAVVDGNVYRVLSRVFGIESAIDSTEGKKYFQKLADELINKKDVANYNQAIMEFGALYCRPVNPDCINCIFADKCIAFQKQKVNQLPYKAKKIKVRDRYFNYFLFTQKQRLFLQKRLNKDIWQDLYEFYLIETPKKESAKTILKAKSIKNLLGPKPFIMKDVSREYKHILSHQHLHVIFYHIELSGKHTLKNMITVKLNEINKYAFPRLIEKYLKDKDIIE